MENKFLVTACRFHTKKKNRLLIMGWFYQNEMKENQLLVCMDKKKIPFSIDEIDMERTLQKTREGVPITNQYFLWIDLPKTWKKCKCLEVKNFYHGVGNTAFRISVSNLKKFEGIMQRCVDGGKAEEEGFEISGWYIDQGGIGLSVSDESGNEYPIEIKKKDRKDVRKMYPENTEEEVVGFVASYKGNVPKKVRVQFEDESRYEEVPVTLIQSPVEKGVTTVRNAYKKTLVYYQQFGITATVFRALDKLSRRESISYMAWLKRNTPSEAVLKMQREHRFAFTPKISIVVALYRTPEKYLTEMIESVRKQSYRNWELCLSDGSGEDSPIENILKQYEEKDNRIKVVYNRKQLRISENTNEGLKVSTGDYIAFADHDDLLAPNALYECVKLLNKEPSTDIIYTDEDKIDMRGKTHFMPHFKPDFNIDMLYSRNYICHLLVVKRAVYEEVGALNPEYDGAQDYDFLLRCIEKTKNIKHIPKILYHWRAHQDSTAENPESKNYAFEAGKKAIQAYYGRMGIPAEVKETAYKGIYRAKYTVKGMPLVSVIIPNKDHIADLEKCISSLEEKNVYKNLEIIVVENNSEKEETFAYYKELEKRYPNVKILFWEEKVFNYPAINNFGAEYSTGEYLLFLNNDTEVRHEDCIEQMLGYCQRSDVGAVGARLYYEDGTLQHAGVVIGLGGVAGHVFPRAAHEDPGYFGRVIMTQDYSAVTAACIMMKKSVFEEVGGFDKEFAVAFNDVDLCLRIREAGYLIVYNPFAELNHYESKSRGYEDTPEKIKRFNSEIELFQKKWKDFLEKGDPYYNPNLTLADGNFGLNMHVK